MSARRSDTNAHESPGASFAKLRPWLLLLPVLVAAALLQAPALQLPFFADDYLFLDQVRDRSLPATLASGDPLGNFFRPIGRQVHFWWLSHVSNESPVAFHIANITAWLTILVLLFAITRRVAGLRAGIFAASFLGLHYASDVAIRWASGSQDLLAVAAALLSILFYIHGRRFPAAIALLAGLLCKETVVFAPFVAIVLSRTPGTTWRDAARAAWPLFVAVGVWAVAWLSTADRLSGAEKSVEFNLWGLPAALLHLVQVVTGIEWAPGGVPQVPGFAPLIPLALVLVTSWIAASGSSEEPATTGSPRAITAGAAWAVLGALPIAAVASIWSAYYYVFALCGAALLLGAWLARVHVVWGLAALALFAWGSQSGRHLNEFSTSPNAWNTQSHVNRFYMDRSMSFVSGYLDDMASLHPTLPERSTVFFSGIPANIAWQSADGPLIRWAYRDSSLRSYWLTAFSLDKVRRGPVYSIAALGDSLVPQPLGPAAWAELGLSMLLDGKTEAALDAMVLAVEDNPDEGVHRYRLGMTRVATGDSAGRADLVASGAVLSAGPSPHVPRALQRMAAADTSGAWQEAVVGVAADVLDPGTHALLADLALTTGRSRDVGFFESFVAVQLEPESAFHWRRWGMVLATTNRHQGAVRALDRYIALGGAEARNDAVVQQWLERTRPRLPGGSQAGQELRRLPGTF